MANIIALLCMIAGAFVAPISRQVADIIVMPSFLFYLASNASRFIQSVKDRKEIDVDNLD